MKIIKTDEFQVIVEKKKIKNMYLRICSDGSLKVTAPFFVKDSVIRDFIFQKTDWIRKNYHKRDDLFSLKFINNGRTFLWGKEYPVKMILSEKEKPGVFFDKDQIMVICNRVNFYDEAEEILMRWYRGLLMEEIKKQRQYCEKLVGRAADEWRIRNMKTRWGSCNISDKRIWINLQLVKKPLECLVYVMIHELIHFYERNHNAAFWKYMDRFCPDWRKVKKMLNTC